MKPESKKQPVMGESHEQLREATLQEVQNLPDKLPARVWLACLIAGAERFSFYGVQAMIQNSIQYGPNDNIKGILGLGQATATRINYTFTTIVYLLPMFTGVVADGWWGKYRMIKWATAVYLAGLAGMLLTTIPPAIKAGAAPAGYITGLVLIAIGLGGCQSTIVPFIADQYEEFSSRIKVTTKGQQVVITRDKTLTYIYSLYFCYSRMVNVGSLSSIATTLLEEKVGFWAAYIVTFACMLFSVILLHIGDTAFVQVPPSGTMLPIVFKLVGCSIKNGFNLKASSPAYQRAVHNRTVPWTEEFHTGICSGFKAIKVCCAWPALWLCIFQASANGISQAAQMETMGIPNDAMKTSNAMALVILGIAVEKWLYPALENRKIQSKPMARITVGLTFMTLGIAYGTVVQVMIYHAGPCYQYPTECDASENGLPNHVNVLVTVPMYVLIALGEIFAFITGNEYAYRQAPKDMKSVMQSIYALMTAIGSILGIALSALSQNPLLIVSWGTVTGIMFVVTCLFWVIFHKYDSY
ncbi:oligopeptide transporter [Penicillium frequentans]|nr:oligopeptide transporter [Penicillium glabrum]